MNLNQITIKSSNVDRSVQFYQQLGLQLIVDASPRYVRFLCPNGDSTFSVSHSEEPIGVSTTLYFEVEDVDQTIEQLKQRGLVGITPPKDQRWQWRESELTDPDGHPIIIFTAGSNRKDPPWRIPFKKIPIKNWFDSFIESPVNLLK